ncbi:MAG TPA: type III-B CRISPR module-associated protein Cmr5, partial [Syntrophomonas wolfei]|nr:type III-B CRISPR module-associated protein Cmr5 [Syntrophomonas wolfei]
LVKCLISLPSVEYRTATVEVLALFNWLRRFAEGLIEGVVEDEN